MCVCVGEGWGWLEHTGLIADVHKTSFAIWNRSNEGINVLQTNKYGNCSAFLVTYHKTRTI